MLRRSERRASKAASTRTRSPVRPSKKTLARGKLGAAVMAGALLAGPKALGASGLSAEGERKVASLLSEARRLEGEDRPVAAFLALREAERLTQIFSHNTAGEEAPAARAMERFTAAIVSTQSPSLLRILHSAQVPLADKLGLIHRLEGEVILEHPEPETLDAP